MSIEVPIYSLNYLNQLGSLIDRRKRILLDLDIFLQILSNYQSKYLILLKRKDKALRENLVADFEQFYKRAELYINFTNFDPEVRKNKKRKVFIDALNDLKLKYNVLVQTQTKKDLILKKNSSVGESKRVEKQIPLRDRYRFPQSVSSLMKEEKILLNGHDLSKDEYDIISALLYRYSQNIVMPVPFLDEKEELLYSDSSIIASPSNSYSHLELISILRKRDWRFEGNDNDWKRLESTLKGLFQKDLLFIKDVSTKIETGSLLRDMFEVVVFFTPNVLKDLVKLRSEYKVLEFLDDVDVLENIELIDIVFQGVDMRAFNLAMEKVINY